MLSAFHKLLRRGGLLGGQNHAIVRSCGSHSFLKASCIQAQEQQVVPGMHWAVVPSPVVEVRASKQAPSIASICQASRQLAHTVLTLSLLGATGRVWLQICQVLTVPETRSWVASRHVSGIRVPILAEGAISLRQLLCCNPMLCCSAMQ